FGGPTERSTDDVPGFVPHTGNLGVAWRHARFSARVAVNYVGDYIRNYTAVDSPRNRYRHARTIVNAGVAYHYRPWLNLTLDVGNLFNEPEAHYRGYSDRMQTTNIAGTTIT